MVGPVKNNKYISNLSVVKTTVGDSVFVYVDLCIFATRQQVLVDIKNLIKTSA